jgi:hypothetical protein
MSGVALLACLLLLPADGGDGGGGAGAARKPPVRQQMYEAEGEGDEAAGGESIMLLEPSAEKVAAVAGSGGAAPVPLLTWGAILCSRSTHTACMAYVYTPPRDSDPQELGSWALKMFAIVNMEIWKIFPVRLLRRSVPGPR